LPAFPTRRWSISRFLISGGLAGLAGISEVSGAIGQLRPVISPGYGFTAIIVAFLGRLNPLGIVAAGLILALTYLGGEAAQISIGITDKVTRLFQGLLLFFVLGCDTLIHYRIRLVRVSRRGVPPDGNDPSHHPDHHDGGDAAADAALGELVVERSGVLNLGVEGMMIMGAVSGLCHRAD
jgi:ABC-type uncharacterized transport system permease subunit